MVTIVGSIWAEILDVSLREAIQIGIKLLEISDIGVNCI